MANPTQTAINLIYTYVSGSIPGGWTHTNIFLVSQLNTPYWSGNPVARTNVGQTYTSNVLYTKLSQASLKNLAASPDFYSTIIPSFDSVIKSSGQLNNYVTLWTNAGYITQSERNIINNYVNVLTPDPNYASGIAWSNYNIGRSVDLQDLNSVRQVYLQGSGVTL